MAGVTMGGIMMEGIEGMIEGMMKEGRMQIIMDPMMGIITHILTWIIIIIVTTINHGIKQAQDGWFFVFCFFFVFSFYF